MVRLYCRVRTGVDSISQRILGKPLLALIGQQVIAKLILAGFELCIWLFHKQTLAYRRYQSHAGMTCEVFSSLVPLR